MALRPKPSGILLPMRVWDAATRLFHWSITLLVVISYVSISLADRTYGALAMRVHVISGEAVLAVLLFRVLWGVFGSETARFSHFLHSPWAALGHLRAFFRREPDTQVGHNHAGGWMVIVLLLLLGLQVATGLGANDDGLTEGPLVRFMSHDTSNLLSKIHAISFKVLLAAMIAHVLAVIAYAVFKRQNLLRPMITGKKRLPAATRAPRMASPVLAVITMLVAAGIAAGISLL